MADESWRRVVGNLTESHLGKFLVRLSANLKLKLYSKFMKITQVCEKKICGDREIVGKRQG